MKKYHIILLLLLGIFLMPTTTYACGGCCEKHSYKKESTSKQENGGCCESDSHTNKKEHHGCSGKCGHSKCVCPPSISAFTVVYPLNFKNIFFGFSFERQKYSNTETFISSGFYSIWLIPKIS